MIALTTLILAMSVVILIIVTMSAIVFAIKPNDLITTHSDITGKNNNTATDNASYNDMMGSDSGTWE